MGFNLELFVYQGQYCLVFMNNEDFIEFQNTSIQTSEQLKVVLDKGSSV